MHSIHGDIHEIGLQDDCEECRLHAEKPMSNLDHTTLSNLVVMTLNMRMERVTRSGYPRSETEAIARANVMNTLERMGRIYEVMQLTENMELVTQYFQHCWRIDI